MEEWKFMDGLDDNVRCTITKMTDRITHSIIWCNLED